MCNRYRDLLPLVPISKSSLILFFLDLDFQAHTHVSMQLLIETVRWSAKGTFLMKFSIFGNVARITIGSEYCSRMGIVVPAPFLINNLHELWNHQKGYAGETGRTINLEIMFQSNNFYCRFLSFYGNQIVSNRSVLFVKTQK